MSSINKKISLGVLWNLASLFMTRGASTIFTLFLARLLAPEAFGLIAMATIVFELANVFVNSGLGTALIRAKSVTSIELNTVFYTNILLSGIAYSLLFIGAPYIADFYNQIELTSLIQVMGLTVFINATKIVQTAIFSRNMNFKALMKSNTTSVVLSGILGVASAWYGLGVWSLVIQTISMTSISALVLWLMSEWRPKLEFNYKSFIQLFKFSKNLLAEGLLDVTFNNSYILVIGRLYSAELTGLYFFAKKINDLVSQQLTSAVQQATLPALSTIQNNNSELKKKYRQIIQITIFIITPSMGLLAAVAPILLPLAFKKSWLPAVPYLQMLCIVGMLYPIHAINVNLLLVKGRSDLLFKIGLIKRIVSISLLLLATPYGITGIIIGQIISSLFALLPNSYFTYKLINYSLFNQVKDIVKPFISTLIACVFLGYLIAEYPSNSIVWFVAYLFLGVCSYLCASYLIKAEGMMLLITQLKSRIRLKGFLK